VRVVRNSTSGEEGYEVWVSSKGMLGLWGAACGQAPTYDTLPVGWEALETLRIEAGIPSYGADLEEDTLPLEANLWNALSFTKGCYIGQEIVERARSRGRVNWKLVGMLVDSPVPPEAGDKLLREGKEMGEVTSSCVSPSLGRTVALGFLRREVSDPGVVLHLASTQASVRVVPLPFYPPEKGSSD
jgi:folate-binding protein YgfZ